MRFKDDYLTIRIKNHHYHHAVSMFTIPSCECSFTGTNFITRLEIQCHCYGNRVTINLMINIENQVHRL